MHIYEIEKYGLLISLNPETGALAIKDVKSGLHFTQNNMNQNYRIANANVFDDKICFDITCSDINICVNASFEIQRRIQGCGPYAELILSSEEKFNGSFLYPPSFDAKSGDIGLFPLGEGFAFPVDDPDVEIRPVRNMFSGSDNSMNFWGILRRIKENEGWIVCAVENGNDAQVLTQRGEDGLLRTSISWLPQKGEFGYRRIIRFFIGDKGGITAACKAYRNYRKDRGYVVTLKEKAKKVPNIYKLIGAADVWLWNNDAMYRLYNKDAKDESRPKELLELRCSIAAEMKAKGMEKVLWSEFEDVNKDTISYINNLGFLTTCYDNFKDVIPKPIEHLMTPTRRKRCRRIKNWPDDIITDENGYYVNAWMIMGVDGNMYHQHALCDIPAVKCIMEDLPEIMKKKGYSGRFLDVVLATALSECYHPMHSMTRSDSMYYRKVLLKYVNDAGLVCGTEMGHEDAVPDFNYSEGIMSPPYYRAYDSGRRMTTLYYGDDVPEKIKKFMLNPKYRVPLWELVYHDCIVSYWYWGDSSMSCPEYAHVRDLFNSLYGTPPLYSFDISTWEILKDQIVDSYKRASYVAQKTGYYEMLSFEYLSEDKLVQKTVFADGTAVIANFGEEAFTLDDGTVVPGMDKVVINVPVNELG